MTHHWISCQQQQKTQVLHLNTADNHSGIRQRDKKSFLYSQYKIIFASFPCGDKTEANHRVLFLTSKAKVELEQAQKDFSLSFFLTSWSDICNNESRGVSPASSRTAGVLHRELLPACRCPYLQISSFSFTTQFLTTDNLHRCFWVSWNLSVSLDRGKGPATIGYPLSFFNGLGFVHKQIARMHS